MVGDSPSEIRGNELEDDAAGYDAAEKDDDGPEQRAVHQAGRQLHDFAGDERNDDLQELHAQQDEHARRTGVLHALDQAIDAPFGEHVGDVGPRNDHDDGHDGDERDKPCELEHSGAVHGTATHRRLLVGALLEAIAQRFGVLAGCTFLFAQFVWHALVVAFPA